MEENLLNLEDYPYNNASKIAAQDWAGGYLFSMFSGFKI
jgi:hypothetical protein